MVGEKLGVGYAVRGRVCGFESTPVLRSARVLDAIPTMVIGTASSAPPPAAPTSTFKVGAAVGGVGGSFSFCWQSKSDTHVALASMVALDRSDSVKMVCAP